MANTQQLLFDPTEFKGSMAIGLPADVVQRARVAANSRLFGMPRYSRTIGTPDEERGVEFWASRNEWHEYCGSMGSTLSAQDIALNGARKYMSAVLGVDYFRFTDELQTIASEVAAEYHTSYPLEVATVMLEPGW